MLLIPLAAEYQIADLQDRCESAFRGSHSSQITLLMLTTAEKLDLKDLREEMIANCARKMPIADLELQKKSSDNDDLGETTYWEVMR